MVNKDKAMGKIKARRQRNLMQYGIMAAIVVMMLTVLSPLQLSNPYLRSASFETVTVQQQDSVWDIASRYTQDKKQVRRLTEAIIEINALSPDAEIKAGQRLQIPVLHSAADGMTRLAER